MCCVCTFKLCAVCMCRVYTYCMYLYGEALISRHLVLRGNSLPVVCPVQTKASCAGASRELFYSFVWGLSKINLRSFSGVLGQ